MKGYINLFEGECIFMGDRAYEMTPGDVVTILSEQWKKEKAVLEYEQGRWILKGLNFTILQIQGILAWLDVETLKQ